MMTKEDVTSAKSCGVVLRVRYRSHERKKMGIGYGDAKVKPNVR